jgi:membrane associated rhomboid family serine protease
MLVPYSTDAPIYHWPVATVGLIVTNVAIFIAVAVCGADSFENWVLVFSDGLHPDQWLRSFFMHASWEHLIGNMVFLWVFGLVVEGKLGWWRFLCCYLAIGLGVSILEQLITMGVTMPAPGSVGSSTAIFGIVAMAAIWAPKNDVTFFWWFMFRLGTFDIGIATLAVAYIGLEIVMVCIFGTGAGSSILHLLGFALGVPLGIVLLKRGMVDCEGWDLFHVWHGDYGACKKEPEVKDVLAKVDAEKKKRDEQLLTDAKAQLRLYLQSGNIEAAFKFCEKLKCVGGGMRLERSESLAVIQWLLAAKRWKDAAPYMADFIASHPDQADPVRIKLAQICITEQRPGKAIELLVKVNRTKLPEKQAEFVNRMLAKARQMQDEGVVELDVEGW